MALALVIGSGAREHAIAARLADEGWDVAVAPGNAGIARWLRCLPLSLADVAAAVKLSGELRADLVVVGPEAPLVAGMADALSAAGRLVFGPGAAAARIEGSKAFAKEIMAEAGIPTAAHRTFDDAAAARDHARKAGGRVVIKADGIAAGKGVTVCDTVGEAEGAIEAAMVRRELGEAGARVVLEERLEGRELSLMALCDGRRYALLPPSQDYKRVGDGDQGPNTGGMGAVSPPPVAPPRTAQGLAELSIAPALDCLARRGTPFRGALYAGLMLTPDGPRVLEYNCRLGDPETQVLMERVDGPVGEAMAAAARGDLEGLSLGERGGAVVGVVACAPGYPQKPRLGDPIAGLAEAEALAAIRCGGVGGSRERPVTAGGRVLTAVARGRDIQEARERAYRAVAKVAFDGMHYRRDVGR